MKPDRKMKGICDSKIISSDVEIIHEERSRFFSTNIYYFDYYIFEN